MSSLPLASGPTEDDSARLLGSLDTRAPARRSALPLARPRQPGHTGECVSGVPAKCLRDLRRPAGRPLDDRAGGGRPGRGVALPVRGDHHAVGIAYYQNTPMLGRLLAEWGDRPAGALFLLPLWNPVLVAEQVGTLAGIAEGPFIMQVALGDGHHQFASMGADITRRPSVFEANLDIIRRLLAGETVSAEYPRPIAEARIAPSPQNPCRSGSAPGPTSPSNARPGWATAGCAGPR